MDDKHKAIIETHAYTPSARKIMDAAYAKRTEVEVSLSIDARGDRISFDMTEHRFSTNRSTGISLVLTREEWNALKELIVAEGGTI